MHNLFWLLKDIMKKHEKLADYLESLSQSQNICQCKLLQNSIRYDCHMQYTLNGIELAVKNFKL